MKQLDLHYEDIARVTSSRMIRQIAGLKFASSSFCTSSVWFLACILGHAPDLRRVSRSFLF
jgi:hypothetical protein